VVIPEGNLRLHLLLLVLRIAANFDQVREA
jgi:hypothetical protein